MSEPKLGSGAERPEGKRESSERAENPNVNACLKYLSESYGCSEAEAEAAKLFLQAHPSQARDFSELIAQCESEGKLNDLNDCGLIPLRSTTFMELRNKPAFAQITLRKHTDSKDAAADSKDAAADSKDAAADSKDAAARAEKIAKADKDAAAEVEQARLSQTRLELASKLGNPEYAKILAGAFPEGKFDLTDEKHLERIFSALKDSPALRNRLLEAAKANDAATGGSDLEFFATKFRELGVIDHAEYRKIIEASAEKRMAGIGNPESGRGLAALRGTYSTIGDGRTFFALDRAGYGGKFDEFVRVSPDGKSATKEIVGKYGYSLTIEPVSLEDPESAVRNREAKLADVRSERKSVEDRAKFVEETFGPGGSKIPSADDPKFEEFRTAAMEIAKDVGAEADPENPKRTLESIRNVLKTQYLETIELAKRTEKELEAAKKESSAVAVADGGKSEREARDALSFLDSVGVTALGPKATETLLRRFAAAGCENGRPKDLEKLMRGKIALAETFRTFVEGALGTGKERFDAKSVPPVLKAETVDLAKEFREKGLLTDAGELRMEAAQAASEAVREAGPDFP